MQLRNLSLNDYEEFVNMLYCFIQETNEEDIQTPKYFYYKEAIRMINDKDTHIIIASNKKDICGFSVCRVDTLNGMLEDFYSCDYCYVKPEYRNTKAGYMLFKNGYNVAKENNLAIRVNGRIENGVAKMIEKHFKLKPKYTLLQGEING